MYQFLRLHCVMQEELGIYIAVRGIDGSEIQFKVRNTTAVFKIMQAYMSKKALAFSDVRFIYDGELLGFDTGKTIADHGMVSGDAIDALPVQCGD